MAVDKRIFRNTFTENEVIGAATVALVKGQYVEIGEYTVKADEYVGMGFGEAGNQDSAAGRIYVDLKDNSGTPVAITGTFRIAMYSSQNIPAGPAPVVIDMDLAALSAGSSGRSEQVPFPFNGVMLTKDKKFKFLVNNDAASAQTVAKANSTVLMDVSRILF